MTTPLDKPTERMMQKTSEALSWTAGYIALPWAKVKHKAKMDETVDSYTISADGTLTVNPKWLNAQTGEQRVFILATSMMRFLLRHHDRGVALGIVNPQTGGPIEGMEHEHTLWNKACASIVNAPCRAEAIGRAPNDSVFPPEDYKGNPDAESLYYHLLKTEPKPPPQNGGGQGQGQGQQPQQPPPHAGGPVQPPGGEGGQDEDDENDPASGQGQGQNNAPSASGGDMGPDQIDQLRAAVEALAKLAGKGSAIVDALKPRMARTNYRNVIGSGLDFASTEADERTDKTYSRASRREALFPGLMLPGYTGSEPSLCAVIDMSGSTAQFAQKFIDHCYKVSADYPEVKLLLVVHTDRVVLEEWVRPGGDPVVLERASKFTGGTAFAPAYDAAREKARKLPGGKFDALVHFTDGYNFGTWPMPPAKRLVVGLCGAQADEDPDDAGRTPLPMPAKVIPISMGDDPR